MYQGEKAYKPIDPVRRGYEFGGWYRNDPPTTMFYFSDLVTSTMTLYAKWTKITDVPGATFAEKFVWLKSNALSNTTYTVKVDGTSSYSESLAPQSLSYPGYTNVTINLTGGNNSGLRRTISLSGNGSLFNVGDGVILSLVDYISLQGHSSNNSPLVIVGSGGELTMENNSAIYGNTGFTTGGGVCVDVNGLFTMNDGEIYGNSAVFGGGVYVYASTTGRAEFRMYGGTIYSNTAYSYNFGYGYGGGLGGGVYVYNAQRGYTGKFTKSGGGTINGRYGTNINVAKDGDGIVIDGNGHAVYVSSSGYIGSYALYRDTTAGPEVDLDSESGTNWGL